MPDIACISNPPLNSSTRFSQHVRNPLDPLQRVLNATTAADDIVLGAEELRYAARAVGKVSGLIDVEDVLDALFRDFCIGK